MTWLLLLEMVLRFASLIAKRAERADVEKVVLNEIEILHNRRTRRALDARDNFLAGGMPDDPGDPYRRD